MGLLQQVDWSAAVRDGVAALEHLRGRDEVTGKVGIVGFCFGGGLGFDVAARSAPDALVSYYGSALPELLGIGEPTRASGRWSAGGRHRAVAAPLRDGRPVPHPAGGGAGPGLLEPLPNVTWYGYETADHAFDNPDFFLHDPDASRLAWERTSAWLAATL